MNRFIITLSICFILTQSQKISHRQHKALQLINDECQSYSGAKWDDVKMMNDGIFPENKPTLKKHTLCLLRKQGYLSAQHHFNKDIMRKNMETFKMDQDVIEDIIEKCTVEYSSPIRTAWEFSKCRMEIGPKIEFETETPQNAEK